MLNVLSLYSGIGANDRAAHWAGMQTVAMCDSEPFCRAVLAKNFPGVPIFRSDTEVTAAALLALGVDHVDVVTGGFPCQPYSLAGKRQGANDERDRWPEMFRIIREVRPSWVLGENVRGLVSSGRVDEICADLESVGYEVWTAVLPTGIAVGAPHKRERVLIVAYAERERGGRRGSDNRGTVPGVSSSGRHQSADKAQERGSFRAAASAGPAQPRLGGELDGVSAGLDRYSWPAGRGAGQHEWEAPRLTVREDWRRKRIKALGNSAMSQALYPFFKAMVAATE